MIQPLLCGGESIGTDLSVFLNEDESTYDAYVGVALLERVPIDPEALGQKMLVGRLYNAGVKLCELRRRFGHDNRTIKKWGSALKSGDVDEMIRAFAGRGYRKKATPELIRYARQLYRDRTVLNFGPNYREQIILMIKEVFRVTISASLASAIFAGTEESLESSGSGAEESASGSSTCRQAEEDSASHGGAIVQKSPTFPFVSSSGLARSAGALLHHAGLILFGLWLRFFNGVERQMICQILQGAVNVEQSKSLCHDSLSRFCEAPVRTRKAQRDALAAGASIESVLEVYRRNATFLVDGPNRGDLFYFDPHTKEYTGDLDVLKGWCGRRHGVAKVVNLDFFHTRSGRACFIGHYSPYYDMRERFFMSLALFDQLFVVDRRNGRTFVIDRAIYGLETLGRFGGDFLITWEKGFDGTGWDDDAATISFERERKRNNSKDDRTYRFQCQESSWKRDRTFRRILVKATSPEGREILVSVLCNNPAMDVQDVVWAIFRRWLQENDFKSLDVHYGINQLDSRSFTSFEAAADSFEDRPVDCPEYKELKAQLKNCEDRLAKRVLKLRRANAKLEELNRQTDVLEKQTVACLKKMKAAVDDLSKPESSLRGTKRDRGKELGKKLDRLVRNKRKAKETVEKLEGEVAPLEAQSEELGGRLAEVVRKKSRLHLLISGNYQILDLRRKAYMDALRVTASNLFKNLHERYRPECDDYRDDHERLRLLTRCGGFLLKNSGGWNLQLWLPGTLQQHVVRAMQRFADGTCAEIRDETGADVEVELISGPVEGLKIG